MRIAELPKILRRLLEFDTQNSSRMAGGYTLPLLNYLRDHLEEKGARVTLQRYSVPATISGEPTRLGNRGNLLATIRAEKPTVLLQGHVDTVPDPSGFNPRVGDSFAVGRGAVDMKGSVAGLVRAFEVLLEKKGKLSFIPALLLTSDEESHNFAGIKRFLKEPPLDLSSIEFGICAEPSDMKVKTHLYGAMYFLVRTHGTQLHSSGVCEDNAIEKAVPVLSSLARLRKGLAKRTRDGFGGSILNIGLIRGGEKVNQTPETCEIHTAVRNAESVEIIEDLFRKEVLFGSTTGIEIEKAFAYDPVIVKLAPMHRAAIEGVFSRNRILLEFAPMIGFSEATFLNNVGIPCFVFGPGKFELSHVPAYKERIEIAAIEAFVDIIVGLCTSSLPS